MILIVNHIEILNRFARVGWLLLTSLEVYQSGSHNHNNSSPPSFTLFSDCVGLLLLTSVTVKYIVIDSTSDLEA